MTAYNLQRRAEALTSLAQHLPEPLQTQVHQEALAALEAIEYADTRLRAIGELALQGSGVWQIEMFQKALELARTFPDEAWRADMLRRETLEQLLPSLPAALLPSALGVVEVITDSYWRVDAWLKILPYLPEIDLARVGREAMQTACSLRGERNAAEMLTRLLPHLSGETKNEAFQAALTVASRIESASERVKILQTLLAELPEHLKIQGGWMALAAAREDQYAGTRADSLLAILPHLPERMQADALRMTLEAMQAIDDNYLRAKALTELLPLLTEARQHVAVELVTTFEDERRSSFIGWLAPHAHASVLPELLTHACRIEDADQRASALVFLAAFASEELRPQAFTAARQIKKIDERVKSLVALAPHLAPPMQTEVMSEGMTAVQSVEDDFKRDWPLNCLLRYVPKSEQSKLKKAIEQSRWPWSRATALKDLVRHLPAPATALAEDVIPERVTFNLDSTIMKQVQSARHLPEAKKSASMQRMLQNVKALKSEPTQAPTLAWLVPDLPAALHPLALSIALQVETPLWRKTALSWMIPHLGEPSRTEAIGRLLDLIRPDNPANLGRSERAEAWLVMAPCLRDDQLPEALAVARELREPRILLRLIARLPDLPCMQSAWMELWHSLSAPDREHLLPDLGVLAKTIHALGGTPAVDEAFCALLNAGHWWP
jgi:hypothetical protein